MKKLFLAAASLVILSGCASVEISSTTFHGPEHSTRGSIAVLPINKTQESSLEFRAVSEYLLKKLGEKGYELASPDKTADYSTFITYGIDNGKTSVSSVPLYGRTGGGTSFTTGSISGYGGTSSFSGTTTTRPTYGVVGAIPVSSTSYIRKVNIDIYKNQNPPVKVYEIHSVSRGSCGNVSAVIFPIIDGIFEKFPGVSGKPNTTNVEFNGC